jgi:GT2 family glycosyltransferase
MLNIDDSLQEAGCSIQPDGFPVRHGRDNPDYDLQPLPRFKPVDYVSGACLMVKRDEFLAMGGFQTKYSPAYYEDTDFCLRLLMRGKRVYLASRTSCYHIENATSRDIEDGAWATRTSEAHRAIFLQDWAPYLASRHPADFPKL